jgi:hypothetical protein
LGPALTIVAGFEQFIVAVLVICPLLEYVEGEQDDSIKPPNRAHFLSLIDDTIIDNQ